MATGRVSKFCPTRQRVDSTGGVPREPDTLGFRRVIGLCCHSAQEPPGCKRGCLMGHWSLSVTPGLSVTATNTDNVTLDRIGAEAATAQVKTQLTARRRDERLNLIIVQTPSDPA